MPNNNENNNPNHTIINGSIQTITTQNINTNPNINNFGELVQVVQRLTPPNIPPAVIHEKRDYFPPPPYQPEPAQQMCFTDYWDACFQEEYKLLLKNNPTKVEEIRNFLADLKKEGKTKCLRCFQTFSQDKDKAKFDECLAKKICPECQAKKEEKIASEWREFQQKLGMAELPKNWWGELSLPLALIAFFALIFFGWNKFWAWYESPLTEEWGWDDEEDDEDEKEIKKQADTEKKEPVEEIPAPETMSDSELTKNSWGKVKYWLRNNKVRTFSLISLIFSFLFLVFRIVRFLKKPV